MDFLKKVFSVFVGKVDDSSPGGKVNSTDVAKVLRTTVLVGLASAITYFVGAVDPANMGTYGVFVVPIATAALDLLNKYIKANS